MKEYESALANKNQADFINFIEQTQVDQIQYKILSFKNKTAVKYCSKTYSKNMSYTSL